MTAITTTERAARGIRITATDDRGAECGRVYLYILHNDLHQEPFGFIEDMFVREDMRKHGVGSQLLEKLLATAKEAGCYKVLGTSRFAREDVHAWYEKRGFTKCGYEFRIDLS